MKLIKKLITKIKFKQIMKKLHLLLALATSYEKRVKENSDDVDSSEILASIYFAIDKETGQFLQEIIPDVGPGEDSVEEEQNETIPDEVKEEEVEETPETSDSEETSKDTPEEVDEDDFESQLISMPILHHCSVKTEEGKKKNLKVDGPDISLLAFPTDELAKKFENIYPSVSYLDDILTEAWNKICRMESNKDVNNYLVEKIGKYYKDEFKTAGDWYKVTNTYQKVIKIIKAIFGESTRNPNVLITKPYEVEKGGELILEKDKDFSYIKEEAKPVDEKPEETPKTSEKEYDLKTVQDIKDEEEQEKEAEQSESESEKEEKVEEVAETPEPENIDTTEYPPTVNSYDNFNNLEESIFEVMENAEKRQKGEKDSGKKKAIRKEAREQVRLLVESYYDEADWAKKRDDGTWSPELLNYTNAIIQECQKHFSA